MLTRLSASSLRAPHAQQAAAAAAQENEDTRCSIDHARPTSTAHGATCLHAQITSAPTECTAFSSFHGEWVPLRLRYARACLTRAFSREGFADAGESGARPVISRSRSASCGIRPLARLATSTDGTRAVVCSHESTTAIYYHALTTMCAPIGDADGPLDLRGACLEVLRTFIHLVSSVGEWDAGVLDALIRPLGR